MKSKASTVTFKAPRGCLICHHQAPSKANCAACHDAARMQELQVSETIHVLTTAPRAPDRAREVAFSHEGHEQVTCLTCHTTPVTLAPSPAVMALSGMPRPAPRGRKRLRRVSPHHHELGRAHPRIPCGLCRVPPGYYRVAARPGPRFLSQLP